MLVNTNICVNRRSSRKRKKVPEKEKPKGDSTPSVTESSTDDTANSSKVASDLSNLSMQESSNDAITLSDDEEPTQKEPSKLDFQIESTENESKTKSLRDYFGENESVYVMDAKTTGNIGRYLNVRI